jgi:hypothetical protein
MGASVFAPLALAGLRAGLQRREFKPLCLGGFAMGMVILGSHGQHALHVMIFLSVWILVSLIADRDARGFIVRGGGLFIACALGTGMAAILTQLDSVTNGFRVPGGDVALHYESPWVLPTYMANVALGKICYAPDGLLRSEFTIYAGVAGTGLALIGAIRGFRDRWTRFLAIFAVVALLVAFVKPLAQLALNIPFLNLSMPARWVYVFGFCLTLLAAEGVDAMAADPAKGLRIAGIWGGLTVLAIAFHTAEGALVETIIGIGLAVGALFSVPRSPLLALGFCVIAIAWDLIPNFVCFNSHADPKELAHKYRAIDEIGARDKEPWRAFGTLRNSGVVEYKAGGWDSSVGNNILALYGVEAVMGYESIAPVTVVDYCVAMSGVQAVMGSGRVLTITELYSKMASMANMKYILYPDHMIWSEPMRNIGSWDGMTVTQNSEALPRAYLVSKAVLANDPAEVNQAIQSESFNPRTTVVLETPTLPLTGDGGGTVTWISRETDRIELGVDTKGDSILVVSDTDYPGWQAEVDGKETPIIRANLTFRAIAVPAGPHKVIMTFRPTSARYGLMLSLLSAAAILCYAAVGKRL